MKNELEKKFIERWPWFDNEHIWGFECGDGWFDIIWKLCETIEPFVAEGFQVLQVKEKFGGLRFYTNGNINELESVWKAIGLAEDYSFITCETCGKSGELRGTSWLYVSCDEHKRKGD